MQTECSADLFGFARVESRAVVAGFDGGRMTSDAGGLLLGATDRAIGLVERFAGCFTDGRAPDLIEHEVGTMVGQRILGIVLGYEDLVDHDQLRHDPTLAVLAGKLAARRKDCAPLSGKSTLNRLELGGAALTRYHRIAWDGAKIEALFVDLFLEAHPQPPKQVILDLDATDDPLHGHQEGRFFHGYYDCYCYLPLYIFCGSHLLAAKQRPANIDASAGAVEEVARRCGVCPRGADALVRDEWRRFPVWPGQEQASRRRDCRRARRGRGRQQSQRPARSPVQGIPVVDARQLEPPAPRCGQGRNGPEARPIRALSSPR